MSAIALPAAAVWLVTIALLIAAALRAAIPRDRTRPVRLRVLARALLPRRMLRSASGRLDIAAFLFATIFAGAALGGALVSADRWMKHAAVALGPVPAQPTLPGWLAAPLVTLALFVAYEAAYWLNHWLCHRIPLLWAFHTVHHGAESLSLLTNFRVHPVDTIIFYNMAACMTGLTAALLVHLLGPVAQYAVGGANLIVFVSSILLSYLQHSHLWIALPGRWGSVLLSPAHHQLHHSIDPRHHGCNLGSTLALFDRLAGTLLRPTATRQKLRFGVDGLAYQPHSATGAVLVPFADAARTLVPAQSQRHRLWLSREGRKGLFRPARLISPSMDP